MGSQEKPFPSSGVRRNDIQGLRAVSALLIMTYHIWTSRVSGGVDVFFVVSGYFIGSSILSILKSGSPLQIINLWSKILARTIPSAIVVIFLTSIFAAFLTPPAIFQVGLHHLIASLLQFENIKLISSGAEYLNRSSTPSAYQQFWALSTQFQMYAILTGITVLAFALKDRRASTFNKLILLIFIASISFAMFETTRAPASTYFNPAARIWEFLTGVLLASNLTGQTSKIQRHFLAAIGISLIVLTGIVISNQLLFPGYAAIMPVCGAVMLIAAGDAQDTFAQRLLGNKYLVSIGNISYSIYLIHWPILVFTLSATGGGTVSLRNGLLIIFASIGLAYVLKKFIEIPFYSFAKSGSWKIFGFYTLLVITVLAVTFHVQKKLNLEVDGFMNERLASKPNLVHPVQTGSRPLDVPTSRLMVGWRDFTTVGGKKNGCVARQDAEEIVYCVRGDVEARKSIALIGSSHTYQWEPAFDIIGKKYGLKIYIIGKGGCSLGTPAYYAEILGSAEYDSCLDWNMAMPEFISQLKPDMIVTLSTISNRHGNFNGVEIVPDTFMQKIQELTGIGIPVVGIRDNPWFTENPDSCLWRNTEDIRPCDRRRSDVLAASNPAIKAFSHISNFYAVDFSDKFCSQQKCVAKRDGIFIWVDSNHITRTFAENMVPSIMTEFNALEPFRDLIAPE